MSRSDEFHGRREAKFAVVTRDKDGNPLYLTPDHDAPQRHDYATAKEALDHVGRKGMAWQNDHSGNDDQWKRRRIDHHTIHHIIDGGRLADQVERYPAGWQRGDAR